ncbi:MAG: CHAP domain-containing protein [Patescibacteria group bacterium]|jgi:hypothetical protein
MHHKLGVFVFAFLLSTIYYLLSTQPVYAVKFGINVAGIGDTERAANLVGPGGWIVRMISPDQVLDAINQANSHNLNLVIRASHSAPGAPELKARYAQEWVNAFLPHLSKITNPVYFVPMNEPDNPFEGINCSSTDVKAYLDGLLNNFKDPSWSGKVKLSTPSFDPFQIADHGTTCYEELGGFYYFNQFDVVSYHAYGQMNSGGMDTSASQLKQGNVTAFLAQLGLSGKPVIIDETGVVCVDCTSPDVGGGSMVKYPYTQQYVDMFSTYLHSDIVQSQWTQSNVIMFSMLSYSPQTPEPDEGSWMDKSFAEQVVIIAEGAVGGGTGPVSGLSPVPTQRLVATPTGLPDSIQAHLRNRTNGSIPGKKRDEVNASRSEDCGFLGLSCLFVEKQVEVSADTSSKPQRVNVDSPKPPSNVFESVGAFFSNLFNVSSSPKGYANTYFPATVAKNNQTGLGGTSAEQDAAVRSHERIFEALLPRGSSSQYTSNTNVNYSPNPTGAYPYPTLNITLGPAPTQVAEYAQYLLTSAGTLCNGATPFNGVRTVGLTANLIASCLQGQLATPVYNILYQSAQSHTYLQCVGYVMAVEQGTGGGLDGRNAKAYCSGSVPNGYRRLMKDQLSVQMVQVGNIAIYTTGAFGHIAEIGTIASDGKIKIFEANWATSGSIGYHLDTLANVDCVLQRTF